MNISFTNHLLYINRILARILLVSILFIGCQEEKPPKPINFSAMIDGVLFEEEAHYEKDTFPFIHYDIHTDHATINGKEVCFSLSVWGDKVGTYFFRDSTGTTCQAAYFEDMTLFGGVFDPLRGHITITEIDRKHNTLSGTFEFIANDFTDGRQRKITDGKFYNVPVRE